MLVEPQLRIACGDHGLAFRWTCYCEPGWAGEHCERQTAALRNIIVTAALRLRSLRSLRSA
jgi:hypothetical protein